MTTILVEECLCRIAEALEKCAAFQERAAITSETMLAMMQQAQESTTKERKLS